MKSVHELSAEEFRELKERYIIEFDLDEDIILDTEVKEYYEGTYFVEEDFFCNLTEEEEQDVQKVFDKLVSIYDTADFLEDSGEEQEAQKVRATLDLVSSFLVGIMDKK
jgi:hypothetical protein